MDLWWSDDRIGNKIESIKLKPPCMNSYQLDWEIVKIKSIFLVLL